VLGVAHARLAKRKRFSISSDKNADAQNGFVSATGLC
jgi:hypothetical protein